MTAGPGYPPEPWDLRGQMHAAVFLVQRHEVPVDLPAGCRLVQVDGRVVVTTAWVDYEPGGVLSYRELMVTVLVRRGLRPMPTITQIWVDSPASRDGGRALWGIPKELARFEFDGAHWRASDDDGRLADGTVRPRWRLPGRWPLRFAVVQWSDGRAKVSPVRASAGLAVAGTQFRADPAGPLAFLAGRRPLLALSALDFRMSFGG